MKMRVATQLQAIAVLVMTWSALEARAGAPPAAEKATDKQVAEKITDKQIDAWVQDLADNSLKRAKHQEATRGLVKAGIAVVPKVSKAGETEDPKICYRELNVLKQLVKLNTPGIDKETRTAADAALKKLAKSKLENVARRATEIIDLVTTHNGVLEKMSPERRKAFEAQLRRQWGDFDVDLGADPAAEKK